MLAEAIVLACGLVIGCIKNPDTVTKIINSIHFDNEKLFQEPINLEKYYQNAIENLKNIQLKTAFDEKTVTDDKLKECLKNIGYWSHEIKDKIDLVRNNPNLLHTLNLLSGMEGESIFGRNEFLEKIDVNTPIDEIESLIKYIVSIKEKGSYVYATTYSEVATNGKNILSLNSLYKDTLQKLYKSKAKDPDFITAFGFSNNKGSNKSVDEFLNLLGSLKKGTLYKSSKWNI